MVASWVAVLLLTELTVGSASLSYEERSCGSRSLTPEGASELYRRAAVAGTALVAWIVAGALLVGRRWSPLVDSPGALRVALCLVAIVLALGGALGLVSDFFAGFILLLMTLAACAVIALLASVGGVLARGSGPRSGRSLGAVAAMALAMLVWVLGAALMPLLAGGSGEIPFC